MKLLLKLVLVFFTASTAITIMAEPLPAPKKTETTTGTFGDQITQEVNVRGACQIHKVTLSLKEEKVQPHTALQLDFSSLKPGIPYRLTCGVDAEKKQKISLSLSDGGVGHHQFSITLNDGILGGIMGESIETHLHAGQNTIDMWYMKEPQGEDTKEKYLQLINEDDAAILTVHSCVAKTVSVAKN